MHNLFETQNVYGHIADDLSRNIYACRVLYSLTGSMEYIHQLVAISDFGRKFINEIAIDEGEERILFGAGLWGRMLADTWPGTWSAFIDNNECLQGKMISELPVYSITQARRKYPKAKIYIATRLYYKEIKAQLLQQGFSAEKIANVGEVLDEMQKNIYFDIDKFPHQKDEAFVDAGCFNGEMAREFIKWTNDTYYHIWGFEPDPYNYARCKENLKDLLDTGKMTLFNKGLHQSKAKLKFKAKGNVLSQLDEQGSEEVEVEALDEILSGEKVSFIKMDIEGAELDALMGARRIIREQKPKLAISLHKMDDIFTIPDLILSLNDGYELYLRHYTLAEWDTVIFAVNR